MDTWILVDRMIDGTGAAPVVDAAVGIAGSRIAEVSEVGHARILPSETVWQFHDATLLPGLIDVHTHLSLAADGRPYEQMVQDSDEIMALIGARNASLHLRAGVTTVRENGARNSIGFALREAIQRGYILGPRVLTSGRPVTTTGGHFSWCNGVADGPDGIRTTVRRLVGEGADFIKIMASGGATATSDPRFASYSVEELKVAVEVAHDLNRLTTAHCRANEGMERAVAAEIDCMEHAEFLAPDGQIRFDNRVAELLAASDMYISPTLQAWNHWRLVGLSEAKERRGLSPDEEDSMQYLSDHLEQHLSSFSRLLDMGLGSRIVFGTDAGPVMTEFGQVAFGLELMIRGGMSPMEAVMAATGVAARAVGMTNVGVIAPGKEADLVVVLGDPLQDIQAIAQVAAVFKAGSPAHMAAHVRRTDGSAVVSGPVSHESQ